MATVYLLWHQIIRKTLKMKRDAAEKRRDKEAFKWRVADMKKAAPVSAEVSEVDVFALTR